MEKAFEQLSITDDFMFGVVMRNSKLCKPLLERILGIPIARIEYPDDQKTIDISAGGKSIRLDIYVEDAQNTVYNIEMQTTKSPDLPKRSRYYQGMIDLNLIEKGEIYQKLKPCYVIFICTFDLFGQGRHVYTFENRCKEDPSLTLKDETVKIFLNTKGTLQDAGRELQFVLDYFDGKEPEDAFTRKLEEAVNRTRKNEDWRREYMTLLMRDNENRELGRKEGQREGILLAQNILRLSAQGIPATEIAKRLNLTLEQVQTIVDN